MSHIRIDLPNTNNIWVGFGLANVDTFIICVGFGLANVDTICTLTRYEHDPLIRITTPMNNPYQRLFSFIKKSIVGRRFSLRKNQDIKRITQSNSSVATLQKNKK